ncbi:MAG: hypothetical protein KKH74_14810 [Gammaproteobacteria bacterium]|nr:hypothetical protein [Gammaproteobacteria bacterium]MBU1730837.1 hypothetical protein [Gammaproteobacteria bacterium]MBU1891383.1 hypothetical protein [Gammaproteobacteria bacterium]
MPIGKPIGGGAVKRSIGKKIAFGFSVLSFVGSIATMVLFAFVYPVRGGSDPVVASLLAIIFFLASCGVVLFYIGQPPRYELQPWEPEK